MKAVVQERYGPPSVLALREVERPAVGDGRVLVRVRAASLHPDVWHVVRGWPLVVRAMGAGLLAPRHPIPGTDMAGVVAAVGAGVTGFAPGDEVFGETTTRHQWSNGGAFAEYVCAPLDGLAHKPDNVTFEQAAAVPTSGIIAVQNLRDPRRVQPGHKVLVNGAGGGVGSVALQLVKARGAHVTAVDTAGKRDLLRALGADEVVDFRQEDFTQRGVRYDLIFDVPGERPFSALERALAPGGSYVPIGHDHYGASGRSLLGLLPHFIGLTLRSRFVRPLGDRSLPLPDRPQALALLREHLADGTLTPPIDSTYPLSEAPEALRHLSEDETRGKVILSV